MNFRVQRVSSNRLVRRVQRHANLATLFRAADAPGHSPLSPAATFQLGELAVQPEQPLAQSEAVLAPEAITPPPSFGLTGDATPQMAPLKTSPQAPPFQPGPIKPVSRPAQGASEAALISPLSPPAPASLPTSAVQTKEEDDPSWRRLQTIYRKHQEKQATEEGALPAALAAPPAQTPAAGKKQAAQAVNLPAQASIKSAPSQPASPSISAHTVQRQAAASEQASPPLSQPGEQQQVEVAPLKQVVQEKAVPLAPPQQRMMPPLESEPKSLQAV